MAMRITQSMMYGNYVNQMQSSLGAYMESAEQGSTQKKINTPSDDPAGMYKILNLRNTETYNQQLLSNCDTAKGWLTLEDKILSTQVPTVITSITELAEQASTGTYTAEQRRQIAFQVRQQFGSLLNLANTEFDGRSLFAGHKYDGVAFEEGLALMSENEDWAKQIKAGNYSIEGNTNTTIAFQFTPSADGTLADNIAFRWTNDGGDSWSTDTVKSVTSTDGTAYYQMDFNGVSVKVAQSAAIDFPVKVANTKDQDGVDSDDNMIYIRPTAIYQGDTNDKDELKLTFMGTEGSIDTAETKASGTFQGNTIVRFDTDNLDLSAEDREFTWSYSTDNGMNWVTAKGATNGSGSLRLPLPEGYIDITGTGTSAIKAGAQIMIHPNDADLEYEIMQGTFISVNGVGKDIFGGYYDGKPALSNLEDGRNLFEVVGNFIGYLETNNQDGCQQTLVELKRAEEYILTQSTRVGGLENRVDVAYDILTSQKADIQERMSYIEDIDLTELLVRMQRQQITYQTVLQSASKIMNLSLANYL